MRILVALLLAVFTLSMSVSTQARVSHDKPQNFLMSFKEFKKLSKENQKKMISKMMDFLAKYDKNSRARYADLSFLERMLPHIIEEAHAASGNKIPKQCIFAGWILNTKPMRDPPQCPKEGFSNVTMGDMQYGNVWCDQQTKTVKCNQDYFGTCGADTDNSSCEGTSEGSCCVKAKQGATAACVAFGYANIDKLTNCMLKKEGAQERWDNINNQLKTFCSDLVTGLNQKRYANRLHVTHNSPDCDILRDFAAEVAGRKTGGGTKPPQTGELERICNGEDPNAGQICQGYDKIESCDAGIVTYTTPTKIVKNRIFDGTQGPNKTKTIDVKKVDAKDDRVVMTVAGTNREGKPLAPIVITKDKIKGDHKDSMNPINWLVRPDGKFDLGRLGVVKDDSGRGISNKHGRVDSASAQRYLEEIGATSGMYDSVDAQISRCEERKSNDKNTKWQMMKINAGANDGLPFRVATGGGKVGKDGTTPNCPGGVHSACASGVFICSRVKLDDGKVEIKELAEYFAVYQNKMGNDGKPGTLEYLETGSFWNMAEKKGVKTPQYANVYKAGDHNPTFMMSNPLQFKNGTVFEKATENLCPDAGRRSDPTADAKPFNKVIARYAVDSMGNRTNVVQQIISCHATTENGRYEPWGGWKDLQEEVHPGKNTLTLKVRSENNDLDKEVDLTFDPSRSNDACGWVYDGESGSHMTVNTQGKMERRTKKGERRESIAR